MLLNPSWLTLFYCFIKCNRIYCTQNNIPGKIITVITIKLILYTLVENAKNLYLMN